MRILFDNVNFSSSSGPNSFGRRLALALQSSGHQVVSGNSPFDVQLSFIESTQKNRKTALRLDGIYFNTRQNWQAQNLSIKKSYDDSNLVIFQSNFNKALTEKFFGTKDKSVVIGNGTCLETIKKIPALQHDIIKQFSEIWCCSSSWRPHKRLKENIRYFLEIAPKEACLIVAGENPDFIIQDPRVIYAGQLPWETCVSLYKKSKVFLHLAFLDHCPNVVVDARASGCQIVVASSGGTKEIAGPEATIVDDLLWDMNPLDLYTPPALDFNLTYKNSIDTSIDITEVTEKYVTALKLILEEK